MVFQPKKTYDNIIATVSGKAIGLRAKIINMPVQAIYR